MVIELLLSRFGGYIGPVTGKPNVRRYRLSDRSGLIVIINAIKGEISNPIRVAQLVKFCALYNINF
jgi:hypothetical protein